jgi:hypothetical protein
MKSCRGANQRVVNNIIGKQDAALKPESAFSTLWLALGLTLTMAQQLRLSNIARPIRVLAIPIGPGEILGILWIIWVLWDHVIICRRGINRTAILVLSLVLVTLAVAFAGTLSALYLDHWDPTGWRDFLSITFILTLLFAFSLRFNDLKSLERFCLILMATTFMYLFPLFLLSRITTNIGSFKLYYDIDFTRFTAFANYPGQIAYFLVVVPFLSLHFLNRSKGTLTRCLFIMLAVAAVIVGIYIKNDSFNIGVLAGSAVFATIKWTKLVAKLIQRYRLAAIATVLLTIILVAGGAAVIYDTAEEWARNIYKADRNQGDVRIRLASHALESASFSPLVGLGPGMHSRTEYFLQSEGHNVFVDITAAGGLLGLSIFVCFTTWVGWCCWRTRSAWLGGAFVAIMVFSLFNNTLRHPLYLLTLLIIGKLAVLLHPQENTTPAYPSIAPQLQKAGEEV